MPKRRGRNSQHRYADLVYSMRHGVSSRGRRGVGVHGGRAAAAPGRPSRDRGRARHGRLQRRRPGRRPVPVAGVAYGLPDLVRDGSTRRPRRPRRRLSSGLPHGESQRLVPELVGRVAHVVDLGADFRLPVAAYEQWYGEAHAAPSCSTGSRSGCPSCSAPRSRHAHVATPGCYPTAAALALAPLLAPGSSSRPGIIVDAASGVSGRGRGLTAPSLFAEANENVSAYGLLTHRPHRRDRARAGPSAGDGAGAVHAAPRPHDPRDPGHLLRPPASPA